MQVRVLPGVPFRRVSPTTRDAPLRTERLGVEIPHAAPIAHVVQCRDGALKTRTVSVQIRPWAPSACSPMKRRPAQTGKVAGASPATRTISGMPTGQASRASVLTSACLIRACGASPRHSAILCARSSKRAGGFITRIALDECLDPERYRTRVPCRNVVEGVRIDEELARKASVVHPIASANLAPSAIDGRSPA